MRILTVQRVLFFASSVIISTSGLVSRVRAQEASTPTDPNAETAEPAESATSGNSQERPATESGSPAIESPNKEGNSSPSADGSCSWCQELRVGPSAALGFPHIWTLGADSRFSKECGLRLQGGTFTYSGKDSDTVQDLKVKISHFEGSGLWYPWQGTFFVALTLGWQKINVSARNNKEIGQGETKSEINLSAEMDITSIYWAPEVGWTWLLGSDNRGFTLGSGIGLQLPLRSYSKFEAKIEDDAILDEAIKRLSTYQELEDDVRAAGRKAGMLALPKFEIIRAGWLF